MNTELEKLRVAYIEAGKACKEAGKVDDEAWKAYNEAERAYYEAERAYDEARKAYNEAWRAYDEEKGEGMPENLPSSVWAQTWAELYKLFSEHGDQANLLVMDQVLNKVEAEARDEMARTRPQAHETHLC